MRNAMLVKWEGVALAVVEPLDRLPAPMHILSGEAVDLARFCEHHWRASVDSTGRVLRPGLELAARPGRLVAGIATELLELQEAFAAAHTEYLLALSAGPAAPVSRAEFVLGELVATLEYAFDDGEETDDDARLRALAEEHVQPLSHDALAAALDDYAAFAERSLAAIQGLGGFDVAVVAEARELARQLRAQSADRLVGQPQNVQREALALRNRLATLLYERMSNVRTAARFVFRHEPELVRKVTSAYQRRRRAEARRAKQETSEGEEAPA